jgi:uncharacterized protein YgbK (DUF1537 family)
VTDRLLNESGMEHHPLTPMTDADLRRWLAPQSKFPIGHVSAQTVFDGPDAISKALRAEQGAGKRHIVVDAIRDADLVAIGTAAADLRLITGGSGVALGLPRNFGCTPGTPEWQGQSGPVLALSGSCSTATRAQVARHAAVHPTREVRAEEVIEARVSPKDILDWALSVDGLPLVFTSADPEQVKAVQDRFGRDKAAAAIEGFFADLASRAVAAGVTRIVTAGGETSGAVVEALEIEELTIGPEIDPGVPALRARQDLVVALKSGNFGAEDFFEKAARRLDASDAR